MNSPNTLAGVGERLSFAKLFIEKGFKVEIPIIQRDYAQGRSSESELRAAFLAALHAYLSEGKPNRDLDFVYGSIITEGDVTKFTPLDGQQRLTTLFLLHWYLAQIAGRASEWRDVLYKNGKSLFSYETRASSSEFCDALMANDISMAELLKTPNGADSLSNTIEDKSWFFMTWAYDPTIQSMLVMLDAIHEKFVDCGEDFDKLIDLENPVITFLFLDLKQFKLTDDLYIKMNARGKPLSPFENFKAKLEQRIKTFEGPWQAYNLTFNNQPRKVDGYDYFIHKIDTDWADVFWAYRNELSADNTFDDEIMNFIALLVANYHLLNAGEGSVKSKVITDRLFGDGGKLRSLSFDDYDEMGCFSQGLLEHLIVVFDLVQNDTAQAKGISPYQGGRYYSEDEYFKKVISNSTSYPEKLRFFAFYSFLASGKGRSGLQAWLRVVYNLTENRIINSVDEYKKALNTLSDLSKHDDSIVDLLKNGEKVEGFVEGQVLEERIKAHLLTKSERWETCIINAESHAFFKGQIGFILKFSGIADFYLANKHCYWDEDADRDYQAGFNRYYNSASAVFNLVKQGSETITYLWERAVLGKGKYFTHAGGAKWNLLSSNGRGKNVQRDHSWRRLLRLSPSNNSGWLARQQCVKDVFDDKAFDADDVVESLAKICEGSLKSTTLAPWKKTLIEDKNGDLIALSKQGFIVQDEHEVVLLHHSGRNHTHSELFSRALFHRLKGQQETISPFSKIHYCEVKSGEDIARLEINDWKYNDQTYNLNVLVEKSVYKVVFYCAENAPFDSSLTSVLDAHKFSLLSAYKHYEGDVYMLDCEASVSVSDDVLPLIESFCASLNSLLE